MTGMGDVDMQYKAEDFFRNEFAVRPQGGWASRINDGVRPWITRSSQGNPEITYLSDRGMV